MKLFFHYSPYGFSNVYLLGNETSGDALLVDPADFTEKLLNFIESNNFYIRAVLLTHSHTHHVRGLSTLLKIYDAQVFSSNAEVLDIPCRVVHDGEVVDICGMKVESISVPGHSSDSMVYKIDKLLFTGDTLEAGLIGQTMSRYGNALLREGIDRRILTQSKDCLVLPGHGPPSTIEAESRYNLGMAEESLGDILSEDRYEFFV